MLTYLKRTKKNTAFKEVSSSEKDVWIHAVDLSEADIAELVDKRGFTESLLRDAQDLLEVPRVEYEDDITYFFTRFPIQEGIEDTTAPILIALKDGLVLTVVYSEPQFLTQLRNGVGDVLTTNETHFFIQVMRQVEMAYSRALTSVRKEVHRARVKLNNITNKEIERFVGLEGVVNDFTAALIPTSSALQSVLSGKWLRLGEEDKETVEDLIIATQQTVESAKSVGRTIVNIRSAYSILISNRLNTTLEVLTGLTVILTIPMVVASLYGMNVPLPFQNSSLAFVFIIVSIGLGMWAMWYTIKRDKLF
ncbi:MAG: hypothetical protein RI911_441 [Candidatus Parcubacteria bacterium]|jgi:magnesium transporter